MKDYEYLSELIKDGLIKLSNEEKKKLFSTCNICCENKVLYVFNKCGHTCCKRCFKTLDKCNICGRKCHICGRNIKSVIKLIL